MFSVPVLRPRLPELGAIAPYLRSIDTSRYYTNGGPLVELLEKRLAAHYNVAPSQIACVSSATMGLMLAMLACDLPRQSPCIVPSWTFAASAHAVLAAGLAPNIVDVDPFTGTLTPNWLNEGDSQAAADAGMALVVALYGAPVDTSAWSRWADEHGRKVVIDAAAGFDTVKPSGLPTVVSLHATKALASGEGAFVICTDEALIARVKEARNFGFGETRSSERVGFNGKMSEYHAAVGNASLDEWSATRVRFEAILKHYSDGLGIAPRAWVSATAAFPLNVDADKVVKSLGDTGIETRRWWGFGLHRQAAFERYSHGDYPHTEVYAQQYLGLPCYLDIQPETIDKIVRLCAEAA